MAKRILVPLDRSEASRSVLPMVADMARGSGGTVRLLHVAPDYDTGIEGVLRPFFDDFYTIRFDNYAVADEYLHRHEIIPVQDTQVPAFGV